MPKGDVTAAVLKTLRSAFESDPGVVECLLLSTRPCSQTLANHPHIQVRSFSVDPYSSVCVVGLINGILSELGEPMIAVQVGPEGGLLGFQVFQSEQERTNEAE